MSVQRTIENNEEVGIRLSKIYQSFVAATESSMVLGTTNDFQVFIQSFSKIVIYRFQFISITTSRLG
ncbi:hypothetical protein Ahy_A02g009290 [Arachis hypogaea]|uniref:Uncharacterized protein n=1 Tax=Arachis hypogaea TaxID=3818 RepID=A0A445EGK5_ARAHY|nr:hypothetical protein Ahy_A02g009290 [Arachis hypogaea]